MKLFTIFSLSLFLFIGYRTYIQFNDLKETEKIILLNESQSLAKFVSAFRQTYQDAFVDNHIAIDDKMINLLPVKTISEISKRFSHDVNGEVIVRTVSDRPRNSDNMANDFELNEIQYFKDNPSISDNFVEKEGVFNYTKPLHIQQSCLKCHGKREDAIPSIRQRYATSYDYKVGDIRGLLNIEIKKRDIFTVLYMDFLEKLLETIFFYILFIIIIYILIYKMRKKEEGYTHKLEHAIKKKTKKIQKQKEVLHEQAYHDALTGLPNRALFQERLKYAAKHAKRYKTNMALFFIDLDHFKEINDSLGHNIGDKLLIEVTKRFKSHMRDDDTLSRLGGDEFTVIMENLEKIHNASILAEKLQEVLSDAIHIDGHTIYVTCSIGISAYPQDSQDIESLLKYADVAMYKAKEEGRNNIQFYSAEMTELALERFDMQTHLRKALINHEFVLYYQPQIDVKRGDLIGVEALIRWNHPEKGFILPEEFIDIAEETGIIIEIDKWVMETAMKQMIIWNEKGVKPGVLSLNLSMRELRSDDFVAELSKTMRVLKFNPQWLELEITESQVMQKPEDSIMKLQEISQMGVDIVIDDFGTGYSSLAYLKRLPVHKVKIDQSFIHGIPHDQEDLEIVKAIIALSRSLKLEIIAEGVETEEQINILFEYGCEYIQGFYFSKPIEAKEIEKKYFNLI